MHAHSVDYLCAAGYGNSVGRVFGGDDKFQRRRSKPFNANMITIPASVLRQIYDHTEASYPNECCGLMVGSMVVFWIGVALLPVALVVLLVMSAMGLNA